MAENPLREVELVPYDQLPEEPTEFLREVDGAMMAPDLSLILNGQIRDLTYFANSDPGFDEHDFYEQIWSAGWWHDRMWVMPHTADLPLIYYDRSAYSSTSLIAAPTDDWTWDDLLTHAELFTSQAGFEWGILERNQDLLYSYAYNQSNACEDEVAILCNPVLQEGDITATLDFYKAVSPYTPDVRGFV